jgi:hypothetical protein
VTRSLPLSVSQSRAVWSSEAVLGSTVLGLCWQILSQRVKQRSNALLVGSDLFVWRCILWFRSGDLHSPLPLTLRAGFRASVEGVQSLDNHLRYSLQPLRTQQNYIDVSRKLIDGVVAFDETFYESLAKMVNEEPVRTRDLVAMGQIRSIASRSSTILFVGWA